MCIQKGLFTAILLIQSVSVFSKIWLHTISLIPKIFHSDYLPYKHPPIFKGQESWLQEASILMSFSKTKFKLRYDSCFYEM